MTDKEIIEGKGLIAIFMGMEQSKNVLHESGSPTFITKDKHGFNTFMTVEMMKYHSSWDWQIPAWSEAIQIGREMGEGFSKYEDFQKRYRFAVSLNKPDEGFEVLVEVIKWINENQSA